MPQLPRLRNVELWAEGSYTDLPAGTEITGFHYFNVRYLSGYTNQGNVLGGWVGRQGVGGATSTRWWVRPDSSIQVSYRNNRISSQFMQGGGRQHDLACTVDVGTSSGFRVGGSAQYERWRIPILSGRQEQNLALSIQVSYMPKLFRKQSLRQEAN